MTSLATHARWTYRADQSLMPHTLLLEADGFIECPGLTSVDHDRVASSLSSADWQKIRTNGLDLSPVEVAVHARAHEQLGFGAFAAAVVRLNVPASFRRPVSSKSNPHAASSIAQSADTVGRVHDRISGPPFIALGTSGELTDCIVLTWSHQWCAFRSVLRSDFLVTGVDAFAAAFPDHKRAVQLILGETVLGLLLSGDCHN